MSRVNAASSCCAADAGEAEAAATAARASPTRPTIRAIFAIDRLIAGNIVTALGFHAGGHSRPSDHVCDVACEADPSFHKQA